MRDRATSAVEVVSASLVAVGAWLWTPAAGLVVAGVFGLAFARGMAR